MAKVDVIVQHDAEGGNNISHHLHNFVEELKKTGHVVSSTIVHAAQETGDVAGEVVAEAVEGAVGNQSLIPN